MITTTGMIYTRMLEKKLNDPFLLPWLKPKIPWNPAVMLVDFAVAPLPVIELAGCNPEPLNKHNPRNIRLERPGTYKINNGIPYVMRNPDVFQISPRLFFKDTCSSISSDRTSFFLEILASSPATFFTS